MKILSFVKNYLTETHMMHLFVFVLSVPNNSVQLCSNWSVDASISFKSENKKKSYHFWHSLDQRSLLGAQQRQSANCMSRLQQKNIKSVGTRNMTIDGLPKFEPGHAVDDVFAFFDKGRTLLDAIERIWIVL